MTGTSALGPGFDIAALQVSGVLTHKPGKTNNVTFLTTFGNERVKKYSYIPPLPPFLIISLTVI